MNSLADTFHPKKTTRPADNRDEVRAKRLAGVKGFAPTPEPLAKSYLMKVDKRARFPDGRLMDDATKEAIRKAEGKVFGAKQEMKRWQGIRDYLASGGNPLPNGPGLGSYNHPALHKI